MKKYEKLMSDILDSIFEGYSYDGELKVINEKAARKAAGSLHKLVLEKSRDLWDQLEAAEGSLADVAEEISFEELNTDPSSMDTSTGSAPAAAPVEAPAADAGLGIEEPTLESILGSESDIDFDSIFEMHGDVMDAEGDSSQMVDGDQDYEDLEMGMDDAAMGSPDMEGDQLDGGQQGDQFGDQFGGQQGDQMGDQFGDQQMDDEFGMEMGGQQGDQMGGQLDGQQLDGEIDLDSEGGFDFDLDLEGEDPDAEMEEGFGKAYRMESDDKDADDKDGDKDKDDDDDDDDDKDDKKKGKKALPWEKDDKDD